MKWCRWFTVGITGLGLSLSAGCGGGSSNTDGSAGNGGSNVSGGSGGADQASGGTGNIAGAGGTATGGTAGSGGTAGNGGTGGVAEQLCTERCERAIGACLGRVDETAVPEDEDLSLEATVNQAAAQSVPANALCVGFVGADGVHIGLKAANGEEWVLSFAKDMLASDYFSPGAKLSVEFEAWPVTRFSGPTGVLKVREENELSALVMHAISSDSEEIEGFGFSTGAPICRIADNACSSMRAATTTELGDSTVNNACGAELGDFTVTHTLTTPGFSTSCVDAEPQHFAAVVRRR